MSTSKPLYVASMALPAPERSHASIDVGQIVAEQGAFVLRTLRRLGVPARDVQDVAQEVFMVLYRRDVDRDKSVDVRAWLFGIMRRVVANHLRKAHVRREVGPPSEAFEGATERADDAVARSQDRALLDAALAQLDDEKRAVFVLYELEGLAMAEVAKLLGCPTKTAYSRLAAARDLVQRSIRRNLLEGGSR